MEIFSKAEQGFPSPYRMDVIEPSIADTVEEDDTVVILHFDGINDHAKAFNRRGSRCSHLVFGMPLETTAGVWPFMYDSQSRPFFGRDAIDRWLVSCSENARNE